MPEKSQKRPDAFEKLARLVKEEGEDVRAEVKSEVGRLEKKVDEGFSRVERRLDQIIQTQLDMHAGRIKKLEAAVFAQRE